MPARIRLKRMGKKHKPVYKIVVVDKAQSVTSGNYLDNLGMYDPLKEPTFIDIDAEKTKEWLGKGATPSERVEKLLKQAKIIS